MVEINKELAKDLSGLALTVAKLPFGMAISTVFTMLDAIAEVNELSHEDVKKLLEEYIELRSEVEKLSGKLFK